MTFTPAVREYLLALADDEHLIGARHTSWIGLGPFLEEDLAFCSIAQDELGHAIGLYELLLADGDKSVGLDAFAMSREPGEYRSCWLAEIECSDWNDSLVRHWLYDRGEALRWEALASCADDQVAAFAARAQREEAFHLAHAEQFMARVAATDATGRVLDSITRLLPLAVGLWDPTEREPDVLSEGFVETPSAEMFERWRQLIGGDLERWGLAVAWPAGAPLTQHHRTVRSDSFSQLHADLQRVITLDPTAVW